jgi:hypothetical protein
LGVDLDQALEEHARHVGVVTLAHAHQQCIDDALQRSMVRGQCRAVGPALCLFPLSEGEPREKSTNATAEIDATSSPQFPQGATSGSASSNTLNLAWSSSNRIWTRPREQFVNPVTGRSDLAAMSLKGTTQLVCH